VPRLRAGSALLRPSSVGDRSSVDDPTTSAVAEGAREMSWPATVMGGGFEVRVWQLMTN